MRKVKLFIINGLALSFISFFLQLIGVSFGVYISNKIDDEAVGLYQLLMSTYSFGITLAFSGINLACTRIVSEELAVKNLKSIKIVMRNCLLYSLFFGVFAFLLFSTLANVISKNILHSKISISTICIMAFSFPFASICSCLNGYFSAVRHVVKSAVVQIAEQIFKMTIVGFFLSRFFDSSINSACLLIVLGNSISEVFSCFIMFLIYKFDRNKLYKKYGYKESNLNSNNITKRIFNISLPISSTTYIKSGLSTLKQILIPIKLEAFGLSCSESLSKYGMINGMVFPILLFPSTLLGSFSGLLIPEFSSFNIKGENEIIKNSIYKIIKYTLTFSFFIFGIFFCFANELSFLIYHNNEIADYIIFLTPIIIFMYLDNIVDGILKGLNKQVSVMIINIIDLISTILLICLLLPLYGIKGYLCVLFTSEILNCTLSIIVLLKSTKLKFDLKQWIIKPCFSCFISTIILNFIKISSYSIFPLLVNLIIYTFIFCIICFFIKLISKKEINYFL